MTRLPLYGLVILTCQMTPAAGQTLEQGRAVRVVHRCRLNREHVMSCTDRRAPRETAGQFVSLRADTLRFVDSETAAELAIPTAAIDAVLTVDGKRGNFWAGAGIGLMGGAALGAVIASQLEFCVLDCSPATPFGVIIGAPLGALIGGVVGSQIHSDRWRSIEITPQRVGLSIAF